MKRALITKRIITVILSIALMFGVMPISRALSPAYDLWVGGVQITASNANDVFSDGKVKFDSITNTLTLNNYSYDGTGYAFDFLGSDSSAAIYSGLDTLKIVAMGNNTVSHNESNYASYGIYTLGNLIITEASTGTLTVTASESDTRCVGIFVKDKDFTVDGGTVTAEGGVAATDNLSTGIWCFNGNIIVNKNASLTGIGGEANISRGICAFDKIVINGGTVRGNGGAGQVISHGISTGSLEINSDKSQLIGTAVGNAESVGIYLWNDSVFSKGYLKGISNATQGNQSFGVFINNKLTIKGGTVVAEGANGAFNNLPVIDSVFSKAKVWYGDNEDSANTLGAKDTTEINTNYTQKHVSVEPACVITFTDEKGVYKTFFYKQGETVVMPEAPTKDGYTVKWEKVIDKATGDATVRAVYSKISNEDSLISPETADNSNLWAWLALAFLSGVVLIGLTLSESKRKAINK